VLDGQETIENLGESPPYLPFMGHFLFFKLNSIKNIMPKQYLKLAQTQFQGYFNKNAKFDLNGATIWHKVVVINQIKDAEKMMKAEEEMLLLDPLTPE
jgi:homoserine dehydrogenase